MSNITLDGTPNTTNGKLPAVGTKLPSFDLASAKNQPVHSNDFAGKRIVMNLFPSVATGVCSAAARQFNTLASQLENTVVLCVSKDLPFAQQQFCAAEGLENVVMLSDYASGDLARSFGVEIQEYPFYKLLARAVVVADADGKVIYTELVPDIANEPNYEALLKALK